MLWNMNLKMIDQVIKFGKTAIANAKVVQPVHELQSARKHLEEAIAQLREVPPDEDIHGLARITLQSFQRELDDLNLKISLKIYTTSTLSKVRRIRVAACMFNNLLKEVPSLLKEMPRSKEELEKCFTKAGLYVESAVLNTHSLADFLAQIVNVIILKAEGKGLDSGKVKIYSVKKELRELIKNVKDPAKRKYGEEVGKKFDNLLKSRHFKYISAFANTTKHREVLNPVMQLFPPKFEIPEFEYGGEKYPNLSYEEVISIHTEEVIKLILDLNTPVHKMYLYMSHGD